MTEIKPKFIDTGTGEDEEEAADVAIYDARKAELVNDPNALLPEKVSAMLLGGDRLLKALRRWRAMTQTELAARTGLGQGYLSDLESGRRQGTEETLATIAKALDVPPSWLIASAP